jgi:hypothetical protein
VLAWASGRKNRLVRISKDSAIVVKENTAVSVLQTQFNWFPVWEFRHHETVYINASVSSSHRVHHSYHR